VEPNQDSTWSVSILRAGSSSFRDEAGNRPVREKLEFQSCVQVLPHSEGGNLALTDPLLPRFNPACRFFLIQRRNMVVPSMDLLSFNPACRFFLIQRDPSLVYTQHLDARQVVGQGDITPGREPTKFLAGALPGVMNLSTTGCFMQPFPRGSKKSLFFSVIRKSLSRYSDLPFACRAMREATLRHAVATPHAQF